MTDRICAFTVTLARDMRDDDVDPTVAAIRQLRGVLSVEPIVASVELVVAERRADATWRRRLYELLGEAS